MWNGVRGLVQAHYPKLRLVRHFCAAQSKEVVVDKAALSKLRKKTGFQLFKCKDALVQFNNDVKQAEAWMREQAQKEGWAKAGKLAERPMSQGLVGLIEDGNSATIVEVNCETDFVGKTEAFQKLVKEVAVTCHSHFCIQNETKMEMGKEASDLKSVEQDGSLGDVVALNVGNVGENMFLRRAINIRKEPDTVIKTYIHDSGPKLAIGNCKFGKFAAIVKIEVPDVNVVASEICQHVIGMNPKSIGVWELPKQDPKDKKKNKQSKEDDGVKLKGTSEESAMLNQEFLLDSSLTVRQYIQNNSPQVLDFVRIQCGEELEGDD